MAETKIISIPDGKVCDYIDGKFRNDTPEEYVRQTIEKRLVNEHKYAKDRILEIGGVKTSEFVLRSVLPPAKAIHVVMVTDSPMIRNAWSKEVMGFVASDDLFASR